MTIYAKVILFIRSGNLWDYHIVMWLSYLYKTEYLENN